MISIQDVTQTIIATSIFLTTVISFRNGRQITRSREDIQTVHKAVNNTAQEQNARTDQLTAALTDADVAVPPRPEPPSTELL